MISRVIAVAYVIFSASNLVKCYKPNYEFLKEKFHQNRLNAFLDPTLSSLLAGSVAGSGLLFISDTHIKTLCS